jgi:hypothetical protein
LRTEIKEKLDMKYKEMPLLKGWPEGTDRNTVFRFSNNGKFLHEGRLIDVDLLGPGLVRYKADNDYWYKFCEPITVWEPKEEEYVAAWCAGVITYRVIRFSIEERRYFDHFARIDTLKKVPGTVQELKELVGEGNWI